MCNANVREIECGEAEQQQLSLAIQCGHASDCLTDFTLIMASSNINPTAVSLANLNADVLLEIFSYLDHTSLKSVVQVCKVLKAVGYTPLLWRDTIVKIGMPDTAQSVAESYRSRNLKVLKLSLSCLMNEEYL